MARKAKTASDAIMLEHMARSWERIAADVAWVSNVQISPQLKKMNHGSLKTNMAGS
jgi:hypothetical protein